MSCWARGAAGVKPFAQEKDSPFEVEGQLE